MTLEEKKMLAKFMGYQVKHPHKNRDWLTGFYRKNESGKGMYGTLWEDWNPDTDHKQFAEVWLKLGLGLQTHLNDLLCGRDSLKFRKHEEYETHLAHLILTDLPKVMSAVIELLNEGG